MMIRIQSDLTEAVARLPVIVSIKENIGAVGCLSAHLARAALRTEKRVLMVDLTRGGALGASFPCVTGSSASALTASQLFRASVSKQAPEALTSWLSIIRADVRLMDASISAADAAQRIRASLEPFAGRYDVCMVEICEEDGPAIAAVLPGACCMVTTTTTGNRASGTGPKRLNRLLAAAAAAAAVAQNSLITSLTLLPLARPLSNKLDDVNNMAMADRLLSAVVGESAQSLRRMVA